MKYSLVLSFVFLIGLNSVFAQQGSQRLRLAQSIYEQGRLHELPTVLKDSALLNFSKEDKVSAYKLLTLAHIYLEEPELADQTMLKLLNADHFFEPNPAIDPAEFIGLYKTFRTKPVFNVGLKVGVNSTIPLLSDIYYVSGGAQGKGKYSTPLSLQIGVVFEKNLFASSNSKILKRLTLAPELLYDSRSYGYTNSDFADHHANFKATVKQTFLSLNPIVQLKMNKSKTLQTYLAFGPGFSYILSGSLSTPSNTWTNGAGAVSGPDIDNTNSYLKISPSVIGAAGFKFKFGAIYLTGEGRIQYGFVSPVNSSSRSNVQSVFDYNYTLPTYKPFTVMANFGFVFPYFNPIKLKRK
jgi:hypothetical protein